LCFGSGVGYKSKSVLPEFAAKVFAVSVVVFAVVLITTKTVQYTFVKFMKSSIPLTHVIM